MIQKQLIPCCLPRNASKIWSLCTWGRSGRTTLYGKFTVPNVQDGDKQLKHFFPLSNQCPSNLRHTMCRLWLSVICIDTGLAVTSNANPTIQALSCVLQSQGYFYSWDFIHGSIADILITDAHHCMQSGRNTIDANKWFASYCHLVLWWPISKVWEGIVWRRVSNIHVK